MQTTALVHEVYLRLGQSRSFVDETHFLRHLSIQSDEGLLALNDAIGRLAREMPRLADVVECRFFAGYGEEDTVRALGVSLRTVQRDWLKARAWLYRELGGTIRQA
jgi:DNA-directed RNA polymerase specialized sigma24 family protein